MINSLGQKLRTLRKGKKLTLEQLAEITGSSKSYIWELENKNPPRPSAEKVSRLAEALGVTTDFLFDSAESSPTRDVLDEAFYRDYRRLPTDTKEKIRQMVKVWGKAE